MSYFSELLFTFMSFQTFKKKLFDDTEDIFVKIYFSSFFSELLLSFMSFQTFKEELFNYTEDIIINIHFKSFKKLSYFFRSFLISNHTKDI